MSINPTEQLWKIILLMDRQCLSTRRASANHLEMQQTFAYTFIVYIHRDVGRLSEAFIQSDVQITLRTNKGKDQFLSAYKGTAGPTD